MNFIRDNIVKIIVFIVVFVIAIIIVVSCSNNTGTSIESASKYAELENKVQNAAIKYVNKNRVLLPKTVDKTNKVTVDTLIKNNYLREIRAVDDKTVTCSGYVVIEKKYEDSNDYRYTPYIKCGKYYETKTIGQYIIDNDEVVSTGDGLYQSNDIYYYKGENPKNYLKIGDLTYRILEIDEDNELKVISTAKSSYSYVWDDRFNTQSQRYYGINEFDKSRIRDSLDFLYKNKNEDKGEILFYNGEQNYIVEHDFCTGKKALGDNSLNNKSVCSKTTSLYVGLINIYDYYRVSISPECNAMSRLECNNYNYLFSLGKNNTVPNLTTLNAVADDTFSYYEINNGELITKRGNRSQRIYPVFYMDSNTLYMSGSGTYEDPYIIR